MGRWLVLFSSLLFLQPGRGFEPDLAFTGSMERVGEHSLSIKLTDRRVIDAILPNTSTLGAEALAARYRMGDEVEVRCKPIPPIWEAATSRFQSLEVTSIRFLRRPSDEEVSTMLEARPREGTNLLNRPSGLPVSMPNAAADSNAPGARELENARRINLKYAAEMPNFVADETAVRYRSTTESPAWRPYDTVESEIVFRGRRAVRQQIRRNGKPWDQPFDALPGFKWYEGFETEISPLFDSKCPTTIDYRGRTRIGGKQLLEYRFRSPVDGCFPFLYFTYQRYNPARTGSFFIDDPGGSVIQVDEESKGFPADFEFAGREEHVFWDYVKIGEDLHLLPVRVNFLVRYSDGTRYRVEVQYRNHRHFEASTNVTFN
jgi:hypothetical protein